MYAGLRPRMSSVCVSVCVRMFFADGGSFGAMFSVSNF